MNGASLKSIGADQSNMKQARAQEQLKNVNGGLLKLIGADVNSIKQALRDVVSKIGLLCRRKDIMFELFEASSEILSVMFSWLPSNSKVTDWVLLRMVL